jgi:hypothetical protein
VETRPEIDAIFSAMRRRVGFRVQLYLRSATGHTTQAWWRETEQPEHLIYNRWTNLERFARYSKADDFDAQQVAGSFVLTMPAKICSSQAAEESILQIWTAENARPATQADAKDEQFDSTPIGEVLPEECLADGTLLESGIVYGEQSWPLAPGETVVLANLRLWRPEQFGLLLIISAHRLTDEEIRAGGAERPVTTPD